MNSDTKIKIKKHARGLWILGTGLTFVFVFVCCSFVLNALGMAPDAAGTISVDISVMCSVVMYIAIAVWETKNL